MSAKITDVLQYAHCTYMFRIRVEIDSEHYLGWHYNEVFADLLKTMPEFKGFNIFRTIITNTNTFSSFFDADVMFKTEEEGFLFLLKCPAEVLP